MFRLILRPYTFRVVKRKGSTPTRRFPDRDTCKDVKLSPTFTSTYGYSTVSPVSPLVPHGDEDGGRPDSKFLLCIFFWTVILPSRSYPPKSRRRTYTEDPSRDLTRDHSSGVIPH